MSEWLPMASAPKGRAIRLLVEGAIACVPVRAQWDVSFGRWRIVGGQVIAAHVKIHGWQEIEA